VDVITGSKHKVFDISNRRYRKMNYLAAVLASGSEGIASYGVYRTKP